jgi:hypothetical protein
MKDIKHYSLSWSALDITSYMESMEGYNELPIHQLHDDFFLQILEDVLEENSDYIIEKINYCISNYLSENRGEIIKDIKKQLEN